MGGILSYEKSRFDKNTELTNEDFCKLNYVFYWTPSKSLEEKSNEKWVLYPKEYQKILNSAYDKFVNNNSGSNIIYLNKNQNIKIDLDKFNESDVLDSQKLFFIKISDRVLEKQKGM